MNETKKRESYRLLMLIANQKLAEKAAELFLEQNLPLQYRMNAKGTASSEIMDTLGFGSVDKYVLAAMVPRSFGSEMLGLLHTKLRLDAVNSGIAFTIPLTGVTNLMLRMMQSVEQAEQERKGEHMMMENQHTLIAAIVDRGFSGNVMEAAKAAGAGGGTILHSRSVGNEAATGFWGQSVQEEKEIVLILAPHESKNAIMGAISEKCGMHSDAKGTVVSLPIDQVMGI